MKKFRSLYFTMMAVASLGFLTSCGDDEDDTVTPVIQPKEMATYNVRIMGNQNNSTSGSFFASTDGVVRNSADAKASAALIDFLYYHSSPTSGDPIAAAQKATIASPADAKAGEIYAGTTNGLQTWSVRNATMFKKLGTDAAIYTVLANGDDVEDAYMNSTATPTTSVTELKANDVFAFMTAGGKHGVAKVNSVTEVSVAPTYSTEIRMDVKVEK